MMRTPTSRNTTVDPFPTRASLAKRRTKMKRRSYEPRIVGGKAVMPPDLQRLHQKLLNSAVIDVIS
jgi:hypothetical protein